MDGVVPVVVVEDGGGAWAGCEVQLRGRVALVGDGLSQEAGGAEVELVVEGEGGVVGRVGPPHGPDDGVAVRGRGAEGRVPRGQQRVAEADGGGEHGLVGLADEVGLPAAGVDVGVGAKEGVEGAGLVPAHLELG